MFVGSPSVLSFHCSVLVAIKLLNKYVINKALRVNYQKYTAFVK